ncbi:MAG: carboxypeptidase-like regulatory domain-containing protein [Planctomycetota bacterium]
MNRTLAVLAALAAALGLLAWMLTRPPAGDDTGAARVATETADGVRENADLVRPEPRDAETRVASTAPAVQAEPEPAAAPEPPAPAPEEPRPEYEPDAKEPLSILVVDPDQAPVAGAKVEIIGLRSESSSGSWYGYRGDTPVATTDANGRATLDRWVWVNQDGRVRAVDLVVEHPEFVPFRDSSFPLDSEVVPLERGATVVVTGWHGDPSNVIQDVRISADRGASLGRDAWVQLPDGRLSTSRLKPGPHLVLITYEDEDLGTLVSDPHEFEVGEVGWETLHLELLGPFRLIGELDPDVPRPVVNGKVRAVLRTASYAGPDAVLALEKDADVAADGSFVVEGVRPGDCFVVALCEGWTSERLPPTSLRDAGIYLGEEVTEERKQKALAEAEPWTWTYPRVALPQESPPFVVPMVETGTLEVTIVGPNGAPLRGAMVHLSPNYRVRYIGSSIFPFREWSAETDLDGIARLADIPPDEDLWVSAGAEGMQMTAEDRETTPSVEIVPGETATIRIQLEAKPR